mmetsp:Transcript_10694/g.30294  ORF Transcript_10694/g.30294 Transcript_10694/m.30294 type:complete len:390 (-) Transcript_10694:670-1839(-)
MEVAITIRSHLLDRHERLQELVIGIKDLLGGEPVRVGLHLAVAETRLEPSCNNVFIVQFVQFLLEGIELSHPFRRVKRLTRFDQDAVALAQPPASRLGQLLPVFPVLALLLARRSAFFAENNVARRQLARAIVLIVTVFELADIILVAAVDCHVFVILVVVVVIEGGCHLLVPLVRVEVAFQVVNVEGQLLVVHACHRGGSLQALLELLALERLEAAQLLLGALFLLLLALLLGVALALARRLAPPHRGVVETRVRLDGIPTGLFEAEVVLGFELVGFLQLLQVILIFLVRAHVIDAVLVDPALAEHKVAKKFFVLVLGGILEEALQHLHILLLGLAHLAVFGLEARHVALELVFLGLPLRLGLLLELEKPVSLFSIFIVIGIALARGG